MPARRRGLAREPLVHFVILGGVLFGIHAAVATNRPEQTDVQAPGLPVPTGPIVVDDTIREALVEAWTRTRPEPPSTTELQALEQQWVDVEVLYREGLARGLAQHDPQIRDRIAGQMEYVLAAQVEIGEPTEAELRSWFSRNAESLAQPARVDFTQVFVDGDDSRARARADDLLEVLRGGAQPDGLGDTFSGGRRFRGRTLSDLAERFGEAFTAGLEAHAVGVWTLQPSRFGFHVVRVDRRSDGRAAEFEAVREQALHGWRSDQRRDKINEAKRDLRKRWEIVIAP